MDTVPELNERSLQLLKTLVEQYICEGHPVGSRSLSKNSGLQLSPATIRNVMSDLEELGLVRSPHTSAGRIPTVSGYRLFVDSLLTVAPLEKNHLQRMHQDLLEQDDANQLISVASRLLSDVSQMAGVVTLPKRELVSFRHIEFLPLSGARVLVIFVTNDQEVQNKIIHTSRKFSPAELQQAANFLNAVYYGKSLAMIREAVVSELRADQEQMNREMRNAVEIAQLALQNSQSKDDYVLTGETNLMGFSELADMERLKQLFDAFSQKRGIIHLLDQCLEADGVQIFIGEESGYHAFDQCSLVTAPYAVSEEVVGVLGVIGPTRMSYQKIIPFVDVTAKLLGAALNNQTSSPV